MLIINDAQGMARALATLMNPWMKRLLALRREQLLECEVEIGELGPIIIVQAGDTLAAIEQAAGLPIATNLVDGETYPSPDFLPSWEYCQADHGWHEAVYITSDDGSGVVLLIPDREGIDPTLLAIVRIFGEPEQTKVP